MIKLVLAPNALKSSLSAVQAAAAMKRGALSVANDMQIVSCPMSDGGDGFLEVLACHYSAELVSAEITDPLGRRITAQWGWIEDSRTAIIEMALGSGLALLQPEELNPLRASSLGTGELMASALARGARRILLGLGGSATVDGGMGCAYGLGIRFIDHTGQSLIPGGGNLARIDHLDMTEMKSLDDVSIELITDVDNPLLGSDGAARVFGPQKGADAGQVDELEKGMENLAGLIFSATETDIRNLPGAGAAGGIAGSLYALFGAKIRPGSKYVADLVGLEQAMRQADLALTSEGKIDSQTQHGKAPAIVAEIASSNGVPCIAIAGSIGNDLNNTALFAQILSLRGADMSLRTAMDNAAALMENLTGKVVKEFIEHHD